MTKQDFHQWLQRYLSETRYRVEQKEEEIEDIRAWLQFERGTLAALEAALHKLTHRTEGEYIVPDPIEESED